MRSLFSILLTVASFRANGEKAIVLCHEFVKEHATGQAIAGAGQMRIIALPEPGLYPLPDGSGPAHGRPPVPEGAAVGFSHVALDLDHLVQVWKGHAMAANGMLAIRRTNQKNAGHRRGGTQAVNNLDQTGAI